MASSARFRAAKTPFLAHAGGTGEEQTTVEEHDDAATLEDGVALADGAGLVVDLLRVGDHRDLQVDLCNAVSEASERPADVTQWSHALTMRLGCVRSSISPATSRTDAKHSRPRLPGF